MQYQIKVCEFKDLTPNQRFQLSKLSRRTYWLSERFSSLYGKFPKFHKIVYAVNGNQILGWVLLWKDGFFRDLMIYVHRSFRGQGIGSKLIQKGKKIWYQNNKEKLIIHTDETNEMFFKKIGARKIDRFDGIIK